MTDLYFMERAIKLAKKGLGKVNPNPLVGAVIVKNNEIISEGYHQEYGKEHAEVNAFKNASTSVEGATLYINLEPCCHYGKTGPCTNKIIENKIKRVVIGTTDPNPLVAGKGINQLRENGIEVEVGLCEEKCLELNEVFFFSIKYQRPFVVMKYAMTADGKIATDSGDSKWITNEKSRRNVHQSRGKYMAILCGINTILADNPMLNCRIPGKKNPIRIIVDSKLRLPLTSNIAKTAQEIKTIVATLCNDENKIKKLESLGIKVLLVQKNAEGLISLKDLLEKLFKLGIDSIYLEGGGTLNSSALKENIVSVIQVYIGAMIFGGKGYPAVSGQGVEKVALAYKLIPRLTRKFDNDFFIEYEVKY